MKDGKKFKEEVALIKAACVFRYQGLSVKETARKIKKLKKELKRKAKNV